MIAVASTSEHWIGFAVVVGLMLLITMLARGGLGVICIIAGATIARGLIGGKVEPSDVNDRSMVGILFLGAIIGCVVAFLLPLKRSAG